MNIELTAEIRFRCPHCQKLYCSDRSAFSSDTESDKEADKETQAQAKNETEQYSEFECASCQSSFFLLPVQNELGLYQTEKTSRIELSKCPKCSSLKQTQFDECPNCGILESKFKQIQKLENPKLFEIDQAWSKILVDLTNDEAHQNFLNLAQSHMALNFASQKYLDLQKTMGQDPLIQKYLRQLDLRLSAMIQSRFLTSQKKTEELNSKKISFFDRIQKISSKDIFMTVSILGTMSLIYNKMNPTFPNLTGLIVAATILSYGLWFISLNNSKGI